MIIVTVIAFIVIFSALILVHEWGHFTMARRAGIKVEEFGIGLPPQAKKLFKDKKGTVYSINWIPFGGFVRLFGEDSSDPEILKHKDSYASKSIWQRISVVVAGVVMNFLLAWVLITLGFTIGMKPFLVTQEDLTAGIEQGIVEVQKIYYLHEIDSTSPLVPLDLQTGDYITEVNGIPVSESMVLGEIIQPRSSVKLNIVHENEAEVYQVTSNEEGKLGISISLENFILDVKEVRYPFYEAPVRAVSEITRLSVLTVKTLGAVVVGLVSKLTVPDGVAGPVGIARMTHHFVQQGIMALVQFTALLSISLGVINIMPFPALDGGRFLFIIFEIILRRRPNAKWEAIAHTVGFAMLLLLIFAITWNDIAMLLK